MLSLIRILVDAPKERGGEGCSSREWTVSPSAVNQWLECERKWGFRYIARLSSPSAPSAELGTDGHAQAEAFWRDATPLDFTRPSGAIMQAGQHLWLPPATPGVHLERNFRFESTRTGFIYSGFKDIEVEPNVPWEALGFDGWAPIVADHKTTSSIDKYAKTEEDLRFDPQATLYGLDSMARYESPVVDLGWIYYQTKGSKRSHAVTLRLPLSQAIVCFDAIEREAEKMARVREDFAASGKQEAPITFVKERLEPNPAACGAYGGCPYQHICNLSPAQRLRSRTSNMSLIASLKSRVQGTPAVAEAPKEEPAPNPTQLNMFADAKVNPETRALEHTVDTDKNVGEAPSLMGCHFKDVPAVTEIPKAFLEDPINAPEAALPPPSLENVTPAPAPQPEGEKPKAKRGRPAGSKNKPKAETTETKAETTEPTPAPVAETDDQECDAPHVTEAPATVRGNVHPFPSALGGDGFSLYVDCIPDHEPVVYADKLVAMANEKIVAGGQVAHYKFLKFGEASAALAIALGEVLDELKPTAVFCASSSDALPVLTPRAFCVTRSVR